MIGVCCWPGCSLQRRDTLPICEDHAREAATWVRKQSREPRSQQRSTAQDRQGWVYYLNVAGRLKIGFEKHLHSRLPSYPPGTQVLGYKRGTMADEQAEHQRCTPWRVAGREWYELNDSTLRVVAEAKEAEAARVRAVRAAQPPPPRPGFQPHISPHDTPT